MPPEINRVGEVIEVRLGKSGRLVIADDQGLPLLDIHADQSEVRVKRELVATGGPGAHPDLPTHTALGLAAQSGLDTHAGATDPHSAYALDADLANHEADTTAVHGIANTGNLVLTNDARLSDARTPVAHTHIIDDTTSLQADLDGKAATHSHPYEASGAVATHEAAGNPHPTYATDADLTSHAAGPHGGSLPAGIIVMWGGLVANIPSGWVLCDGQNGTPDLRSRFVKGAAAGADPGAAGGSATHTHAGHSDHAALTHAGTAVGDHTVTQPSAHTEVINHTHTVSVTDPGHTHLTQRYPTATGASSGFTSDTSMSGTLADNTLPTKSNTTGITASTANPGGGVASIAHSGAAVSAHSVTQPGQHAAQSHSAHDSPNSEPVYYALCFIQKT